MRRKNPFPGVTRTPDRHGVVRWRYRRKGFSCYIHGEYASEQFRKEYEAAAKRSKTPAETQHFERGSVAWLINDYKRSVKHRNKSDATRRVLANELDWIRDQVGDAPFAFFEPRNIEKLTSKKDGPAAANKVCKNMSMLFTLAMKHHGHKFNPAKLADRRNEAADGRHTWAVEEMQQFLEHHGSGTKARLVFALASNTGASRQDIAAMT